MFDRMIKLLCVLSAALLAVACVQEKKDNDASQTEDASGVRSDAALKIAIYYVGDAKCRAQLEAKKLNEQHIEKVLQANNDAKYMEDGKNTHRLDGVNAALISKEYQGKKENPMLGGDMFLQANDIPRTLATLEDNCRRLLLSVDAEELPSISSQNLYHTSGKSEEDAEAVDWPTRFAADFGDFGGKITCGGDEREELNSLCSFAQINDGKRYFAYLYPKPGEDTIAAEVTYMQQGKELTETITIENIARDELQLPGTQLSAIKVIADCGDDNSCLFADDESLTYKLECRVEGNQACGNGFSFKVGRLACDEGGSCDKIPSTTRDKLCSGAATVADLSEHEINLKCEFLVGANGNDGQVQMRTNASHLAGRLCVTTTTTSKGGTEVLKEDNPLSMKESACGKVGKDGNEYRLELSFALE